tara:strand:+ start:1371 stop:1670 length:300 start_codon:yes stop_codon:yes gene_type:complete
MTNSTQQAQNLLCKMFEIANPNAVASYRAVMKIAMQFSKAKNCPKDIKFGTIRGHYLAKLNDAKSPLTVGQVDKILGMKALPSADLKAMRAYKKLVSLA